jgi:Mrp family chromosome partitioning ATPase
VSRGAFRANELMNLTQDLSQLIDQLEPIARPGGLGRAIMVMGACKGVGASTVARELARLAALRSQRGVWLYDLDFASNAQAEASRVRGPVFDAGFGRTPFWSLQTVGGRARVVARQSVVSNMYVTELQRESDAVQKIGLRSSPDYWSAVRQSIDLAVIDAPGNATAPLSLVQDLDGVILVADARDARSDGLAARRAAIEQRGGLVAGLIYNRSGPVRSAA